MPQHKRGRGDPVAAAGAHLRACWRWFEKWAIAVPENHRAEINFGDTKNYPSYVRSSNNSSRRLFKKRVLAWAEDLFGTDRPWKLIYTGVGYGLELVKEWSVARQQLQGQRVVLTAAEAEKLRREKHKSLIGCTVNGEWRTAELIGTLSLVNHSCIAPVVFQHYTRKGVDRVRVRERAKEYPVIKRGEEITVCYSKKAELGFECRCRGCAPEQGNGEGGEASGSDYGSDEEYVITESEGDTETEEDEEEIVETKFNDEPEMIYRLRRELQQNTELAGGHDERGHIPSSIGRIYNHISFKGMKAVFTKAKERDLGIDVSDSIFVDVGSGYGAAVLLATILHPGLTSIGIEWFPERVEASNRTKERLNRHGNYMNNVSFYQGDFVQEHGKRIDGATHVWSYDVAYNLESTVKPLFERLSRSRCLKVLWSFRTPAEVNEAAKGRFRRVAEV